jgi:hypothetical protein
MDAMRANTAVAPAVRAKLESIGKDSVEGFKHAAPAKAAKASRAAAYDLAR